MNIYSSRWKFIPILSVVVLLSGCLNDDDVITPAASTLSGTAATGAPIVGGVVTVKCATGTATDPQTENDGKWEVPVAGLTLPCAVEVNGGTIGVGGSANATPYYSTAISAGTVNITPLTSMIVAEMLGSTDLATWFGALSSGAFANINSNALQNAQTAVENAIAGLRAGLGSLNPFTSMFTATSGNQMDDILEALGASGATYAQIVSALVNNASLPVGFNFTYTPPETGGGGGAVTGGSASLTATSSTPTTGNGTLQITSVTVEDAGGNFAGTTNRVVAIGTVNGIFAQAQLYYTIATGNIWNVSYRWGGTANQPENLAFKSCDVSCAGASISGTTVTLTNLQLPDGTPTLATLNGTITSTSITTGAGGGGGGNDQTLPAALSSKVMDLTYQNVQANSPYANGVVLKFTFSESGKLFLGETYRDIGGFTRSQSGEYVWFDATNNVAYAASLKQDGSFNEINVAGNANGLPWYGQFAAAAAGGGENSGGNGDGGAPANLGSLTASNNGTAEFGTSFAPTSLDSVADIGLGWQYKWSVSATHYIQLNGSTVTILNGNPTWQKPLAPQAQLAFDAVNGTLTFTNLTTTTALGGASGPLVLNGTLNLTPLNSGPITLAGTGVNYTGSGFNSPVATFAATATAEVWTWQDARGTTMKLTHVLTTGNYQLSFTGMGATPYLSAMGSLNALGIAIDAGAKTATFTNTAIANNNTSTSATVNGVLAMP